MTGNTLIGNLIPALLVIGAGALIALLYNESRERERLLLVVGATVIACYSLAILLIEHL
jgi:hypothetical protein